MRSRRLFVVAWLAGLIGSFAPAVAGAQESLEQPPPPSAAVVAEYRRTGTGEVHGTFAAEPKGMPDISQTEIDRPVFLLPDIPYTRWMLAEFKRRSEYHAKYPNTHLKAFVIPDSVRSIIRKLQTDESGEYQFTGVPNGKYVLFLDGQLDVPRDLAAHLTEPTHPWAVWVRDAYHATYYSDAFTIGPAPFSFKTHLLYAELLRAAGVH